MTFDNFHDWDGFPFPFTNQLAYQTAFTPAGFNFESPFTDTYSSFPWSEPQPEVKENEVDDSVRKESFSAKVLTL